MPAHLPLPKLQLREVASVSLVFTGVACAIAFGEMVIEPLLKSPERGIWITQALNERDLHHLFGLPLSSESPLPSPDSPLLHGDPAFRHLALVATPQE